MVRRVALISSPLVASVTSAAYLLPATELLGGGAPPTDASVTVDASGDAVADATPASCPDAGFCDDFERPDLLGSWTSTGSKLGGTIDLFATDGGRSLRFVRTGVMAASALRATS